MKNIVYMGLCCFVLLSCHRQEVERLQVQLDIINQDLEIRLPGQLVAWNKCLILFDPFASSGVIRVLDKQDGKQILSFLDIGQGPNEFNMPWCGYVANDRLTVFDLNIKKKIECNMDSLSEGKVTIQPLKFPFTNVVQLAKLGENQYIGGIFSGQHPFGLIKEDKIISELGKYPIENIDITNAKEKFQGTILYNEKRNRLGYATFDTPYLSLYTFEKGSFRLLWESRFGGAHYTISDNQLRWDNNQPSGIHEYTFTKDYIACLVKEMKLKDSIGRSKEQMAKAIYIYDYDGELLKIMELDIPSIRIAATTDSNLIYFISLDEDYVLTKLDLKKYNL